jgi:glycosyltransferase involved in cell wall biosynthesis
MTTNKPPLLSICVPTFNRSAKLKQCLESIFLSVKGFADVVEILISDNNSEDDTAVVVEMFGRIELRVSYVKQPVNVGAEANFWFLWQLAQGQYIWLVGDDDRIDQSAIGILLNEIEAGHDILILGYSRWSADFEACRHANVFGHADQFYTSAEKLIRRFGPDLSFISIVVIRKSLIQGIAKEKYIRLSKTGFSFLYAVYMAAKAGNNSVLIGKALVRNRNVTTASYDWDSYFISGIATVFDALRSEGYSARGIASAKNKVIMRYIAPKFKERRLAGEELQRLVGPLARRYYLSWRLWLIVIPVIFAPKGLLRRLVSIRDLGRSGGSAT